MDVSELITFGRDTANRLNELEIELSAMTVIYELCDALTESESAKQKALDAEREACAEVCMRVADNDEGRTGDVSHAARACALSIRARIGRDY